MSEEVVGLIGERYQDRNTKKVFKLIDRDSKYKTLMFEAEDGSTIVRTYSTFKIQMVIYKENKVAKLSKAKNGKVNDAVEIVADELTKYVNQFNNGNLELSYKASTNLFNLKTYGKTIVEMYVRCREGFVQVMMYEFEFVRIHNDIKFSNLTKRPKYARSIGIQINIDDLSSFLNAMREVIIDRLTLKTFKQLKED